MVVVIAVMSFTKRPRLFVPFRVDTAKHLRILKPMLLFIYLLYVDSSNSILKNIFPRGYLKVYNSSHRREVKNDNKYETMWKLLWTFNRYKSYTDKLNLLN